MKKVLFATTALVAFAGTASAQVTLEGSAEMGIIGGTDRETQFFTDIDVEFILSGETDNGLTFGASIDLDESDGSDSTCRFNTATVLPCGIDGASGAFDGTTQGGETIFISGGPHTFTMGDTDGAFDANMIEVPVGGDIDSVVEHAGYSGLSGLDGFYDGQIARYDYAFDAFTFSFSVEVADFDTITQDVGADGTVTADEALNFDGNPVYGIGATYSFGDFEFGVGYQMVDWSASAVADGDFGFTSAGDSVDVDVHIMGISGAYTMGDFTVGANYSTGEADIDYSDATTDDVSLDYTQYGIGAAYSMDAWTFAANYGLQEIDDGTDDRTASGYGLAIHYDLGGGAVVQFGYGFSDDEDISSYFDANTPNLPTALGPLPAGTDTESSAWSFGVSMSF